ncbi:hypothetical protein ABMA27_011601 [Loxostege sticticalis]|uniref:FP protein C-terminal domain-containing protein n=1 Tax=Loxostege sticticalis TaxID=481309 RepID=A0ABR3IGY4_LOXSC
METCMGCNSVVVVEQTLKCRSCHGYFDYKCLNMSINTFNKIPSTSRQQWRCPNCLNVTQRRGDNSNTPVRRNLDVLNLTSMSCDESLQEAIDAPCEPNTEDQTKNANMAEGLLSITQFGDLLDQRMDKVKESLTSHIESTIKREINGVLQEWKKELDKAFHHVHAQQNELKNQIAAATLKIAELEGDRIKLEQEVNAQAQTSLRSEVEIAGMAESARENLIHNVLVMAQKVGIKLEDKDIDSVARAGAPRRPSAGTESSDPDARSTLPRPVVVRFTRRWTRDDFIKACKSRRNITSKDILPEGPATKLYVNERLTTVNRSLFRDTRLQARQQGYRHCWTKGGTIYVRAFDGAHAKAVRTPADLARIFGNTKDGMEVPETTQSTNQPAN